MKEGLFVLAGMALAAIITFVRDIIGNRCKIKIEKIKIHDKEKLEAYKKLFVFARTITKACYPLADDHLSRFMNIMKGQFENEITTYYLYYSPKILEILDKFDDMYFSSRNRGDLTIKDEEELDKFVNEEFFYSALRLKELVKKELSLL